MSDGSFEKEMIKMLFQQTMQQQVGHQMMEQQVTQGGYGEADGYGQANYGY